jgi:small subunit ribosomal protein S4
MHPWEKDRIEAERIIKTDYGLKNKTEIWRANTMLSRFKSQVKKCSTAATPQLEKERNELLTKLRKIGLLQETAGLDDVLSFKVQDILERRLQTCVFKKGFAKSVKQSRQFIVHGHITVAGKKVTIPSYIVTREEESRIGYVAGTSVAPNNG